MIAMSPSFWPDLHRVLSMQASPSDPENFPFVVLGNKVDLDEGRSRVVNTLFFGYLRAQSGRCPLPETEIEITVP